VKKLFSVVALVVFVLGCGSSDDVSEMPNSDEVQILESDSSSLLPNAANSSFTGLSDIVGSGAVSLPFLRSMYL